MRSAWKHTLALMSYEEAKVEQDLLEEVSSATGNALRAFPRNSMGLVSDSVRATPEYRAAKAASDTAFASLQQFNLVFTKMFARELRAERASRYTQRAKK